MGKAIVYCGSCGTGLLEEDFARRKAVRCASQSFCIRCSPIDVAALPVRPPAPSNDPPSPALTRAAAPPRSATTTRIPRVSTGHIPTVASTRRIKTTSGSPAATALWVGLGALLGLVVLALVVAVPGPSRPRPSAPPARVERPATPVRVPPPPSTSSASPARAPAAASAVEEQMRKELASLRANRLDQDLQEARRLIESAHAAQRTAEIDALLDALSRVAGARVREVVALRTRHEERLAQGDSPPAAPEAEPAPAPDSLPEGLEGHWTLDTIEEGRAPDASGLGRHAAVVGPLTLVPGRHGQAILFQGNDAYLELPRRGGLDRLQEGPYTLAAWFKPTDVPKGAESDNGAFYGIVIKPGLHVGLSYTLKNGGTFEMMHWLRGVVRAGDYVARPSPPGAWHHLAGMADPGSRRTRLYVNGELFLDKAWPEGPSAAEAGYTRKPWRIGIAIPKAKDWGWSAKGAVDDVRLYSRILEVSEIQALVSGR